MLFDNPPQIRWSDKASTGSRAQRSRLLRLTSSRDADLSLMYLKWSKQTALSRWRQWIACTRSTHSEGWHGLWSRVVLVVLSRGWRWSSVEAVQRCIVHGARGVGRPRPARGPASRHSCRERRAKHPCISLRRLSLANSVTSLLRQRVLWLSSV